MPILSICIPTYNRARYLKKSLNSIVEQEIFQKTSDVEIIISDNCSTDNTRQVVERFVEQYGDKVKYFCNEKNLNDKNIELSLLRGTGAFLKVQNDTILMHQNSLSEMVNFIITNLKTKPILFFLNKNNIKDKISNFSNSDEFISHISFFSTWIGGFGMWKEDFDFLQDFSKEAEKKIPQTDVIFRLLSFKKHSSVLNTQLVSVQRVNKKGGYNIAKVFSKNYLDILKDAVSKKIISATTYDKEKKLILLKHINKFYFDINNNYDFEKGNYWLYTKDYHYNFYYYLALAKIFTKIALRHFRNLFISKKSYRKKVWKKFNKGNQVTLVSKSEISVKDMQKISIGNFSYGAIDPVFWGAENEELIIGNYVSIAPGTRFLCGGNHKYTGFSTYPFKVLFFGESVEAISKGAIIIEDDVWIGDGVTILSGVTIGQGAIIGAGSVISKNIPPYAIAAGNPANIIKYRFSEEIRARLKKLDFSRIPKEKIMQNEEILYTELNDGNVEKIIESLL